MISVAIAGSAGEDRRDDEGADLADDAHGVGENAVVGPLADGFGSGFGESVIDDAGPILIHTVVAAGLEEFHGADEPEGIEEIGRHFVGAALAAIEGEEGGAGAAAARFVCEHAAVLVIRMGGDHDEAGAGVQLFEALPESGGAAIDGDLLVDGGGPDGGGVGLGRGTDGSRREEESGRLSGASEDGARISLLGRGRQGQEPGDDQPEVWAQKNSRVA